MIGVTQVLQSFTQIVAPLASTALLSKATLPLWRLLPALMNGCGLYLMFKGKSEAVAAGPARGRPEATT